MIKEEFVNQEMLEAAIMCYQLNLDPRKILEKWIESAKFYAGSRDEQKVIENKMLLLSK